MELRNSDIASTLDRIGDLLEFQGANPFRVRAYRNGARAIQNYDQRIADLVQNPDYKLTDIPGIGKDLAEKISELVQTGKLLYLDELQAQVPASAMQLMQIPGLGPKKAAALFKELSITTVDELRTACENQQVRTLKGFGAKTEESILQGLALAPTASDRLYWAVADGYAQQLLAYLNASPEVRQIAMAGSYRRGKETIGDLDILVDATNPVAVMDRLASFGSTSDILARGDTKMSIRLQSGLQVDLRVVPTESFGAALQYFTGSKEHNVQLRSLAKSRGLKINEYGVFRGEESIAGRTEAEVYAALDLPVFPPEIREDREEFAWAESGQLPTLVELADLQGDLHMHTTETDGQATLAEMVAAAQANGLKYIAITDHSQRVHMANGLNPERLLAQWQQIDELNAQLAGSFLVLKGIEVDILEKGGLDLPDEVLAQADWVVASLHYGQRQPRDQITRRIVEAIEHPSVSVIGHPTGRILNRRPAYDVDLDTVYAAAREHRKLLELNANPARLDLDDLACWNARRHEIPIVISSDAHSTAGLEVLQYGILQARRAGLTKADVANTRSWPELKALIGKSG